MKIVKSESGELSKFPRLGAFEVYYNENVRILYVYIKVAPVLKVRVQRMAKYFRANEKNQTIVFQAA